MVEAALGTIIDVQVVDVQSRDGLGKTKLKLPSGTQYGSKYLIKGKGIPNLHCRGQGNVIVQFLVKVPERLNKNKEKLWIVFRFLDLVPYLVQGYGFSHKFICCGVLLIELDCEILAVNLKIHPLKLNGERERK